MLTVALLSTALALVAILISWLLYGRKPLRQGQVDPLKQLLGPIFTGMERKWFVDEAYKALILDRYVDLARFLAIRDRRKVLARLVPREGHCRHV